MMRPRYCFQFFADRYEQGSILLTSHLEIGRWGEVFGDPTMTTALLDRLTHHAHALSLNGDSYRFREAQARHTAPRGADSVPQEVPS